MDHRIFIATVVALVAVAFGGFYFAFSKRAPELITTPVLTSASSKPAASAASDRPAANQSTQSQTARPQAPSSPGPVTAATIEAEIAQSDHAELQKLLKQHFTKEYNELIEVAVRRRNAGVSDAEFGQELFSRFQDIMRPRLRYAAAAGMPMIDKLAANEITLFHALGTEGTSSCLRVLGKETQPSETPMPAKIMHLMRQATLYRFQAIVDGMQRYVPVDPLSAGDMTAFEASLSRDGLTFQEVRTGAFLDKGGDQPGQPCLMVEKLYRAVARLDEAPRRKVYAGMFFLGRDK